MSLDEKCELEARQAAAGIAFLDALDRLDGMQVHTSHSANARNYAPKEMDRLGLAEGFTKRELADTMKALLTGGFIRANEPVGWSSNRNQLRGPRRVTP
jgi:hypothetical protein